MASGGLVYNVFYVTLIEVTPIKTGDLISKIFSNTENMDPVLYSKEKVMYHKFKIDE